MGYASNIIKSRGYKLLDERMQEVLKNGEIIKLPILSDYVYEKKELKFLLQYLFNRRNFRNRFVSYPDIKKWGWTICEAPAKFSPKWFPGQQVYYYLWDENQTIKPNHIPLPNLPDGHRINMMIKERVIRLEGRNAGIEAHGSWKVIDTKVKLTIPKVRHPRFLRRMRNKYRRQQKMLEANTR